MGWMLDKQHTILYNGLFGKYPGEEIWGKEEKFAKLKHLIYY